MKCMYVFYLTLVALFVVYLQFLEDVLSHVKKNTQRLATLIT